MINVFPCISDNGDHGKKDRLYRAIIVVLRSFVSEKNGVYTWDRNNEILFQDMCKKMPKRYLKQEQCDEILNKLSRDDFKNIESKIPNEWINCVESDTITELIEAMSCRVDNLKKITQLIIH